MTRQVVWPVMALWLLVCALGATACHERDVSDADVSDSNVSDSSISAGGEAAPSTARPAEEGETHLRGIRQLTNAGENAEAYFSADGGQLIFQSTHGDWQCDQIFTMGTDGSQRRLVSTGRGRTTCAYFYPDGSRIVYASTHLGGEACPPPPPRTGGYVWAIYESYDIFSARPDGTDLKRLTDTPGYDAEATVAPDGSRMVFTSVRSGDLELWLMDLDGGRQVQVTDGLGYDGGAFFSPDSKKLCYRASRPKTPEEVAKYKGLIERGLVEPGALEIFVINADGTGVQQVTDNGAANFCPFFHPSGEKIIFASNLGDPQGRNFDLYLVSLDGTDLERITYHETFDGFPMFSPDGRYLVWGSNRHNAAPRDTNVFIAEWVE